MNTKVEKNEEKATRVTPEEKIVIAKAKRFEDFKALVSEMTDEQKGEIRELLGIKLTASKAVSGIRVTGKVQRTDKVLEQKVAVQMQKLIDVLPIDRSIDIEEWGKLAVEAGMVTQQPPARIAAYYKKPIVEGGYAKLIN